MTQQYFVYECWTRDRCRVHKAECKVFRTAQAQLSHSGLNGKWHGPFHNRASAFEAGRNSKSSESAPLRDLQPVDRRRSYELLTARLYDSIVSQLALCILRITKSRVGCSAQWEIAE
jgi:hypothetical protein